MSTRVSEHVIEVDGLPYPATKLIITRCYNSSDDPSYWAALIVGAFYDASGHVLWSTEIFFGQFSWLDESESSDQSDTESDTSSDSSGEESHSVTHSSNEQDAESEAGDEQSSSESSSGQY